MLGPPPTHPPTHAAHAALRLAAKDISQELRRLGLKFGSLPPWMRPHLHQLWQQHREAGAAAAAAAIATALPGGWSEQQVGVPLGGRVWSGRHSVDGRVGW
jgi:hypothetical protein